MGLPDRTPPVIYPESDGRPVADNTLQFRWIAMLKENLEVILGNSALVAAALLWYPVEGQPRVCQAPDVLVALGRPRGYRGSYLQWNEGGVPPQVVFEVLSPHNSIAEMERKRQFYDRHGVREYVLLDPDREEGAAFTRRDGHLELASELTGWESPLLGITFAKQHGELRVLGPDGAPFLTFEQVMERVRELGGRASIEAARAAEAEARADDAVARCRRRRGACRRRGDPRRASARPAARPGDRARRQVASACAADAGGLLRAWSRVEGHVIWLGLTLAAAATTWQGDQGGADVVVADGDTITGTVSGVGRFLVPSGVTLALEPASPVVLLRRGDPCRRHHRWVGRGAPRRPRHHWRGRRPRRWPGGRPGRSRDHRAGRGPQLAPAPGTGAPAASGGIPAAARAQRGGLHYGNPGEVLRDGDRALGSGGGGGGGGGLTPGGAGGSGGGSLALEAGRIEVNGRISVTGESGGIGMSSAGGGWRRQRRHARRGDQDPSSARAC